MAPLSTYSLKLGVLSLLTSCLSIFPVFHSFESNQAQGLAHGLTKSLLNLLILIHPTGPALIYFSITSSLDNCFSLEIPTPQIHHCYSNFLKFKFNHVTFSCLKTKAERDEMICQDHPLENCKTGIQTHICWIPDFLFSKRSPLAQEFTLMAFDFIFTLFNAPLLCR